MQEKFYKILVILIIGYPLLYLVAYFTEQALAKRYNQHTARLMRRSILILGASILTIDLLREFDLKLTALLGSAGIAGVALGFALKTSVSNIISGIFVSLEVPFKVGDFIEIEEHKGTIVSFDLLSVKICSPDNNYIRIPNEKVLKSSVINHSKYPIKRLRIPIQFSYSWQHDQVYAVIDSVITANNVCLKEPPYQVKFTGYADSGINCEVCIWVKSLEFSAAKNSIASDLHQAFIKAGIDMPYPHTALTNATGDSTLKVEIISDSNSSS